MKLIRLPPTILLAAALAGCGTTAVPRPARPVAAPPPVTPRIVQHNSLVGQHAGAALAQFGKPRLDIAEGAGRKLQFAGDACVLDVYLYPASAGREPQATYVDARRGSDAGPAARITGGASSRTARLAGGEAGSRTRSGGGDRRADLRLVAALSTAGSPA